MNRVTRVLVVFFLSASTVWAQSTGEFAGRVTDESGAILPGVTITATQTETGFMRTVATDGAGAWVMPNMPTGPYGRMALRSSYGLAYDFQTAEYHGITATAPPFGNRTLIED